MANRFLICALYLFSLHAVAMAGGYAKEGAADKAADKDIAPADPGAGSVADIDTAKKEDSPSADSVKTNQENKDISIQKSLSFSSFHTGARSLNPDPYPGPVNLYPEPSRPFPNPPSTYAGHYNSYPGGSAPHPGQAIYPTTLYPGSAGSSTPVSTDYVSRYLGPGAVPVVLPDGTIADTPEVVAARVAHLTALQKAQALWYGPQDDGSYSPLKYGDVHATGYPTAGPIGSSYSGRPSSGHEGSPATGYHGPVRADYPGPVAAGYPGPGARGYPGPGARGYPGPSPTGHTGTEASAYPGALPTGHPRPVATGYPGPGARGYPGPSPTGHTGPQASTYPEPLPTGHPGPVAPGFQIPLVTGYQGPLAMPTVLPSGYLADTPEVVAVRTAHLTALVRALEQDDATYLRTASQKRWR